MKVILFGSTGMVGKSVLRQCLLDHDVESVLSIGRNPSGVPHPKLRDLVRADIFAFNVNSREFNGHHARFCCLALSPASISHPASPHPPAAPPLRSPHPLPTPNPTT